MRYPGGELLALTPADFDFEKRTVTINKSYQRLNGQDLITTPKTEKSNRVITMPQFLAEEIQDYIKMLYGIGPDDRMFTVTKSYLHREMDRGAKEAGVPRIRIHDIRHSAVSLFDRYGILSHRYRGPSKPREHRHHLQLCAPVSVQAGGNGR